MSRLTDPAKSSLQSLPTESQSPGLGNDPFRADFLEQDNVSGWWRLSSWAFGLLTLLALILVVVHFGTIEQFTRLALAANPYWFFQPGSHICLCGFGVAAGSQSRRPSATAQYSRSPRRSKAVYRSGGPDQWRQRRDFGCTRADTPEKSRPISRWERCWWGWSPISQLIWRPY